MKLAPALSLLALAGSTLSRLLPPQTALSSPLPSPATLEVRQINSDSPTIRWINSLNGGTRSLKLAIKQYTSDINALRTAELNLNQDIAEGTTFISSLASYSISEATLIYSELSKLQVLIEDLVYDAISKKQVFVRTGNRYFVRFMFEREMEGFGKFLDAVTYRVPEETRALMVQTGGGVWAAWQRGVEAFRK